MVRRIWRCIMIPIAYAMPVIALLVIMYTVIWWRAGLLGEMWEEIRS
jgi:hypothetical protein